MAQNGTCIPAIGLAYTPLMIFPYDPAISNCQRTGLKTKETNRFHGSPALVEKKRWSRFSTMTSISVVYE
jgi:hypothetical protein